MFEKHFSENLMDAVERDVSIDEMSKIKAKRNFNRLKNIQVNILLVGATGSGKSSTINALFNANNAKVGQGSDPETQDIMKYEFNNIVLFDTPGLGDSTSADSRHSKSIEKKLCERKSDGEFLIDLVLVILDGSVRDLGTSYSLINDSIIPNLGVDKRRILIAINQADLVLKGKDWNKELNMPGPILMKALDDKVESVRRRIKESTSVDVDPIYYSAGYKDGNSDQKPFNLSKLFLYILRHLDLEKRSAFVGDVNEDKSVWESDDKKENYRREIKKTLVESVVEGAKAGAEIGSILGAPGKIVGAVVGGVVGGLLSIFD